MSELGNINISQEAIKKSIQILINENETISTLNYNAFKGIEVKFEEKGIILNISVKVIYSLGILKAVENLQQEILQRLNEMFNISILSINILIKDVV